MYEFDGSEGMLIERLIKCLFLFPLLKAMRHCLQSLSGQQELNDSLAQIVAMEPVLSVSAESVVELNRSISVKLSMNPADTPIPPIVCDFERDGIVEYRNSRLHGLKTGSTFARFFICGDLKPVAVLPISVIKRNRIKELILSETELILPENSNYAINCTYVPDDADNADTIQFSSDDESIVTVNKDGQLRTRQAGKCRVYCTAEVTSAICDITVKPYLKCLIFDNALKETELCLVLGEKLPLSYRLDPEDCYDSVITFRSSDYTILNIKNHEAEAISVGQAVLSVQNAKQEELRHWNIRIITPKESRRMETKTVSPKKVSFFKHLFGR